MKISKKTKEALTIVGGTVIGLTLIVVIGSQFAKVPREADTLPLISILPSDVMLNIDTDISAEEKDIVVKPTIDSSLDPVDEILPQTDQLEQSIQPEVIKPAEPSEEQRSDPTQKPNGEKVTEPPKAVEHDKVMPPAEPPKKENEPQGGEINNKGQTYFPGFGWVDGTGDAQGTTADDMYENGNKIGEMN